MSRWSRRSPVGVQRPAFVVGPDGKIVEAWPKNSPKDTPTKLLAALEQHGLVRGNTDHNTLGVVGGDGVLLQCFEIDHVEGAAVGGFDDDGARTPCFNRSRPTLGTDTPLVAGSQPWEVIAGERGPQVTAVFVEEV